MRKFFIPSKDNDYKPFLLRRAALSVYTILLLLVNTFGGLVGIPEVMASSVTPSNIIGLTNQQRAAAGLNTLNVDSRLTAAAQAKANNMFSEQYWDHFGPNGETPWMFISQAGYQYVYAGENLAKGFRTAEGVHEAWMASPTHRDNIMSGNYKDIGVAVVEGELLGKQTTLVVQMFGNLTSQTFKADAPVKSETTKPKATIVESGQIKSISITSPKVGDLIKDANVNIKGITKNITGNYSVEILNNGEYVGEVESSSSQWEYDKGSDWEEGEKRIIAQVKGQDIKSEQVIFTIDSSPPIFSKESIVVKRTDTEFIISFKVPVDAQSIQFVTGDKTFDLEVDEEGNAVLGISREDIGGRSIIIIADAAGNISEHDISEYFLDGDEVTQGTPSLILWFRNIIGTTDGISLAIVSFVFILLSIEVYVYWKKGMLGKSAGGLFTIGAWWLIILVGVFKGFGGIIN
ncbi:hypothetical protein CVU76_00915 [Candidatus Dojkabacteria bacterium HGW-Dojkabacteria-1]|uniref:SCP domain-containing protein n=1 Tax=Candidatus Dojkabacteria bacterium HGW-Dojkabacteria-1 TaxID=2013761 RepID=A0A2N2F360_9BACT|nr:MAG: hypothetical protein CVU76_00915 [Candidatus Dojkabacteria bacterium HGW-Dojkabacteria-1]